MHYIGLLSVISYQIHGDNLYHSINHGNIFLMNSIHPRKVNCMLIIAFYIHPLEGFSIPIEIWFDWTSAAFNLVKTTMEDLQKTWLKGQHIFTS